MPPPSCDAILLWGFTIVAARVPHHIGGLIHPRECDAVLQKATGWLGEKRATPSVLKDFGTLSSDSVHGGFPAAE